MPKQVMNFELGTDGMGPRLYGLDGYYRQVLATGESGFELSLDGCQMYQRQVLATG